MTGFSADWLRAREPVDQRSRNRTLLAAIKQHFGERSSITIIDLACGRGALLRALSPLLPAKQVWHLVDDDPVLLQEAAAACCASVETHTHMADLALMIEDILTIRADLVTTSAFIDLVSDAWLDRLVRGVAARRVPIYLALTYDGRVGCEPSHPMDGTIVAAFNRHQRQDKGFGPALGPTAGESAARKLAAHGYDVTTAPADWRLEPAERQMQRLLVEGWHAAVSELGVVEPADLKQWRDQRVAWIRAGQSVMTVGHVDLWAVPR